MFQPPEEYLTDCAMSMYPCATSSPGHWQFCSASGTGMLVDEDDDETDDETDDQEMDE
jgi:hypothetical protein